jgi:UDPglucose 6-dehydrogenase
MEKAKPALPSITYCSDPYEAAEGADAIVIVTEWDEFRLVDWHRLRSMVERPLVVDGRNMLDAGEMARRGFHYISVGRPSITPEEAPSAASDAQFEHPQGQPTNVLAS